MLRRRGCAFSSSLLLSLTHGYTGQRHAAGRAREREMARERVCEAHTKNQQLRSGSRGLCRAVFVPRSAKATSLVRAQLSKLDAFRRSSSSSQEHSQNSACKKKDLCVWRKSNQGEEIGKEDRSWDLLLTWC